jgi:hypothetical protein
VSWQPHIALAPLILPLRQHPGVLDAPQQRLLVSRAKASFSSDQI